MELEAPPPPFDLHWQQSVCNYDLLLPIGLNVLVYFAVPYNIHVDNLLFSKVPFLIINGDLNAYA